MFKCLRVEVPSLTPPLAVFAEDGEDAKPPFAESEFTISRGTEEDGGGGGGGHGATM